MSLAALKKRKGKSLSGLKKQAEAMNGGFKKDDRILELTRNKEGNGYKVLRLMPTCEADVERQLAAGTAPEDVVNFVKMYSHSFQGAGGWYIENSLTTLGKEDPLAQLNSEEWDDNDKEAQDRVRPRSRKLSYYCNVYVVKDQECPENEGKVMLFRFGKQLLEQVLRPTKPKFPNDPEFDPFCFWDGADFQLKIFTEEKGKNKFPNYTESSFLPQSEFMGGDDEQIEAIYKQAHDISEIVSEDKFKTYEELESRLKRVLKLDNLGAPEKADDAEESGFVMPEQKAQPEPQKSEPVKQETASEPQQSSEPTSTPEPQAQPSGGADDSDDDILNSFMNLANGG